MELSFPENTFDCIYSRECLNYIQQKEELFLRFKVFTIIRLRINT